MRARIKSRAEQWAEADRQKQTESALARLTGYAQQPWTEEKPKAAGRWWWKAWKRDKDKMMLTIFESADGLRVETHGCLHTQPLLAFLGGWWAGPLHEPLDAPYEVPTANDQDQR